MRAAALSFFLQSVSMFWSLSLFPRRFGKKEITEIIEITLEAFHNPHAFSHTYLFIVVMKCRDIKYSKRAVSVFVCDECALLTIIMSK